jgi:hypothetical protein
MKLPSLEFILEWSATFVLLVGVSLTSYNFYPYNVYISLLANLLWLWLGVVWKKWSLIVVEIVVVAMYLAGTIKTLI